MQTNNMMPWFKELLAEREGPCVSIYMPVGRGMPTSQEVPARFRTLVRDEVLPVLEKSFDSATVRAVIGRLETLATDTDLWEGDRDVLAFFASRDYGRVIEMRQDVPQSVEVADSFHVKPLIRALQQSQRYHVLCVSLRRVRLFEGDAQSLTEIQPLKNIPQGTDDVRVTESQSEQVTPQGVTGKQPFYAPGNIPSERYFRMVDNAVWQNYSRREQIPVVVCADVQHLSDILAQSKNDYVMKEGITLNPDAATPQRLREAAWAIIEPTFQKHIETLKDTYQAAKARQLGSDELVQVAEAASIGRVGTLLVDADAKVPGILDRASGSVTEAPLADPRADDVLDDLAEMVLKMDGQVFVIPHDQMPTDQGVAAVYRY